MISIESELYNTRIVQYTGFLDSVSKVGGLVYRISKIESSQLYHITVRFNFNCNLIEITDTSIQYQ